MSQAIIYISNVVNSGTGDSLQTAFGKVNTNFTILFGATANAVGNYANTAGFANTAAYAANAAYAISAGTANAALSGWPVFSVNGLVGNVVLSAANIANVVSAASLANTLSTYATQSFVTSQGYLTSVSYPVSSVAGRTGNIVLSVGDIANAVSTASLATTLGSYATQSFVTSQGYLTSVTYPVTSVAGRTGNVVLTVADIANAVSATSLANTLANTLSSYATQSFVTSQGYLTSVSYPVSSVAGRTGNVVLTVGDIANAVSTTTLANTLGSYATQSFVTSQGYVTNVTYPVSSVAGRTGNVVLTVADIANAVSTTVLANTLATTLGSYATQSFVTGQGYLTSVTYPVTSVAGRTGSVVLGVSDIANAVSTTTLANALGSYATQSFVTSQGYLTSVTFPVTSVAGRTGNVVLSVADIANATSTAALSAAIVAALPLSTGLYGGSGVAGQANAITLGSGLSLAGGVLSGTVAFPGGAGALTAANGTSVAVGTGLVLSGGSLTISNVVATLSGVQTSLASYLPLAGGTMTGAITLVGGAQIGSGITVGYYADATNLALRLANANSSLFVQYTAANAALLGISTITPSGMSVFVPLSVSNAITAPVASFTTASVSGSFAAGTITAASAVISGALLANTITANAITAATQVAGNNSSYVATTAFVQQTLGSYLPLAGGTMSGNITLLSSSAQIGQGAQYGLYTDPVNIALRLSNQVNTVSTIYFQTYGGASTLATLNSTNFNFNVTVSTGTLSANTLSANVITTTTQALGNSSTYVATTAFVQQALGNYAAIANSSSPSSGIALIGDVTGNGSTGTALVTTLANTTVTPGSYGDASHVVLITVDQKGRVTAAQACAISFPTTVNYANTAGTVATISSSQVTSALGYTPISNASVGAANGVAPLNSAGQLPSQYLPSSLAGALTYQGTWDAFTNIPHLANGTANTVGLFYRVSNAGTNLGYSWNVGDDLIYDGATWDKIDGLASEVVSVNNMTGAVVITSVANAIFATSAGSASTAAFAATAGVANTALAGWPVSSVNGQIGNVVITSVANSTFANSAGFASTAAFAATANVANTALSGWPVSSVNGFTGNVTLTVANIANAASNAALAAAFAAIPSGAVTLIGDISANGSTGSNVVTTLATTGVVAGTYGSASQVAAHVVDAKGRIISASNVAINYPVATYAIAAGSANTAITQPSSDSTANIATTAFVAGKVSSYLPLSGGSMSGGITLVGGAQVGAPVLFGYYADASNLALRFNTGALYFQANTVTPAIMYPNAFVMGVPLTINGNATVTGILAANTLTTSTLAANAITTITPATGNSSTYVATTAFVQNAIANAIPAGNTTTLLGCTGIAGTATPITLGGGFSLYGSAYNFGNVSATQWANQGAYISWNYSTNQGETDFINSKGIGAGGFYFYNVASSANASPSLIASISGTGSFTASAGSFSGLLSAGTMATGTLTTSILAANAITTTTQAAGNNSTYAATTAFVQNAVATAIPAGSFGSLLACSGTAGSASVIGLSGGLNIYGSNIVFGNVSGTQWAGQGAYISWNYAGAGGEMDFINSKGGGTGGFNFYNVASNATATPSLVASISGTGSFAASAGSFSGLLSAGSMATGTLNIGGSIVLASGQMIAATAGTVYIQSGSTYIPNMVTISNSAGMLVYVPFAAYSGTFTASVTAASGSFASATVSGSLSAGTIIATTQAAGNNSSYVATTAFVQTAVGSYLPLSGGTMSGNITLPNSSAQIGYGVSVGYYADPTNLALRLGNSTSTLFVQGLLANGTGLSIATMSSSIFSIFVPLSTTGTINTTGAFTGTTGSFSGSLSAGAITTITQAAGNSSTYAATTAFVQTALSNAIPAGNTTTLLGCSGTAGTAGAIALGGGLTTINSNALYFGYVSGTQWQNQGAYISWNYTGSGGEMDFINSRGLSGGGFNFYNVVSNATATPTLLASINNQGQISATSGTFSGLLSAGTMATGTLSIGGSINLASGQMIAATAGTVYIQSGSTYIPNMVTISNSAGMIVYVPLSGVSGTFSSSLVAASGSFASATVSGSLSAGTITATTQAAGNNSSYVATTAFVQSAVGNYLPLSGGSMSGAITLQGGAQVGYGATYGYYADGTNLAIKLQNSSIMYLLSPTYGIGEISFTGFNVHVPFAVTNAVSFTTNVAVTGALSAGSMTTTTQAAGNNSTYVATTAFVQTALSNAIPAGNSISLLGCTGTAGTASPISLGSGLTLYNNNLYFGNVSGAQWQNQGAYITWNYAGGGGETDFINSRGLGGGGFNFYNVASAANATPALIASINGAGSFTASAGSFSGLLSSNSMSTGTINVGGSINLASGQMIAATAGTVYIQSGSTYIPNMVTISNSAGMYVYVPLAGTSATFLTSVLCASATVTGTLSAGTITTPTLAAGNNSTYVATTAFVQTAISNAIPAGNSTTLLGCSGTAGTASAIALSGGLSIYGNVIGFSGVSSTQWYNQGCYFSWNYSGSQGETDFINSRGGGVGGWNFYQVNSGNYSATPTLLAQITNAGNFQGNSVNVLTTRFTPVSGATVTIPTGSATAYIQPAGTIASLTVTIPTTQYVAPGYSTELLIYFVNAVTTLTFATGSTSVVGATLPATASAGTAVKLAYTSAVGAWVHYTLV